MKEYCHEGRGSMTYINKEMLVSLDWTLDLLAAHCCCIQYLLLQVTVCGTLTNSQLQFSSTSEAVHRATNVCTFHGLQPTVALGIRGLESAGLL
jgi:hypothetical protein